MKKPALFSEASPLAFFRKGFTLIELVVVISIIAILSTIALFGFSKAQASARDASRQELLNGLRSALERYYSDNQVYPAGDGSSTTTNFEKMVDTLVTAGYLDRYPTDPSKGCTTDSPLSAGKTTKWTPCGATNEPVYEYDTRVTAAGCPAGGAPDKVNKKACCAIANSCYTIFFTTESTGAVTTFSSPQ